MATKDTYKKGLWAEYMAALIFTLKGYRVLKLRYKTPVGEIDLVAKRGKQIVFVEVKNRARLDDALQAVTPKMARRIHKAAGHYMAHDKTARGQELARSYRFDLLAVSGMFSWRHVPNIQIMS